MSTGGTEEKHPFLHVSLFLGFCLGRRCLRFAFVGSEVAVVGSEVMWCCQEVWGRRNQTSVKWGAFLNFFFQ